MVIARVSARVARFVRVLVNGNYFIFQGKPTRPRVRALLAAALATIRIPRWF